VPVTARAQLLPLRATLRAVGLALLAGAAACVVVASVLGHTRPAWAAWAAGTFVSWAVALAIVVRRRLARAAARAEPLAGAAAAASRAGSRAAGLAVAAVAAVAGGAAATDATHVGAGILAAAAMTALVADRRTGRVESRRSGTLHVDLQGRRLLLAEEPPRRA
jgi:hypothetical protein